MLMEILQVISGCILISIMAWFAYMGFHMNEETNKIYADYFYNHWKQRNES